MSATLYGIPGSHAVRTGELMLEQKGIVFRRVNFPPGPHRLLVRVIGFKGDRVPAVKFDDGRRAQGTRELPRVLDELVPEPRLVPDDPRALEAERWADEVLQQWARRMVASAGAKDPDALAGRGAEGRLGRLLTRRERPRRIVARAVLKAFRVTRAQQEEDRARTGRSSIRWMSGSPMESSTATSSAAPTSRSPRASRSWSTSWRFSRSCAAGRSSSWSSACSAAGT
jgi:glutathione S-transferase